MTSLHKAQDAMDESAKPALSAYQGDHAGLIATAAEITPGRNHENIAAMCDLIDDLASSLFAQDAKVADLKDYAHELQKALTGAVGGGSELFVRHGEEFRADIPFCINRLHERRQNAHDHLCHEIRARKAAEARVAALAGALDYLFDTEGRSDGRPRIVDACYTAFQIAKSPNEEDGGASDWFNDTRPAILKIIAKMKEALASLPTAGEKGDFALVPREPTANMYVKGDEKIIEFLNGTAFVNNESTPAIECYRAMLAAKEP